MCHFIFNRFQSKKKVWRRLCHRDDSSVWCYSRNWRIRDSTLALIVNFWVYLPYTVCDRPFRNYLLVKILPKHHYMEQTYVYPHPISPTQMTIQKFMVPKTRIRVKIRFTWRWRAQKSMLYQHLTWLLLYRTNIFTKIQMTSSSLHLIL